MEVLELLLNWYERRRGLAQGSTEDRWWPGAWARRLGQTRAESGFTDLYQHHSTQRLPDTWLELQ